MVEPVKFTRDSGCLARDKFVVISEGDHMLIYIFVIFLLLGTVLYFHFLCRPMLVHRMTLVSFRLFRKNFSLRCSRTGSRNLCLYTGSYRLSATQAKKFGQLARIFWANGSPPP